MMKADSLSSVASRVHAACDPGLRRPRRSRSSIKWVDQDGKRVQYGDTPPPGAKATPLRGAARRPGRGPGRGGEAARQGR